ncbi:MAG: hypothetical protein HY908_04655 [Myxococcales bacterium]|nr:hypothetical protein [Myxococcales bacterium]
MRSLDSVARSVLAVAAIALVAACSSSVASGDGTGASGTTSSTTTSSTSTTGTGGAGGAGTGGAGQGGAAGGAGQGGADPCAGAYLSLVLGGGDPPPAYPMNAACPGTWGANETSHVVGYLGNAGEGGAMRLVVTGCDPVNGGRADVIVPLTDVGTAASESVSVDLGGGAQPFQTTNGVDVTVSAFGATQLTLILGSLAGSLSDGNGVSHTVFGSFAACRVLDLLAP